MFGCQRLFSGVLWGVIVICCFYFIFFVFYFAEKCLSWLYGFIYNVFDVEEYLVLMGCNAATCREVF